MKILTWDEFRQCDEGTVFSFFKPAIVDVPSVIVEWQDINGKRRNSFWCAELCAWTEMTEYELEPPMNASYRHSAHDHDDDQLFIVYHRADLDAIAKACKDAPEPPFEADDGEWSQYL